MKLMTSAFAEEFVVQWSDDVCTQVCSAEGQSQRLRGAPGYVEGTEVPTLELRGILQDRGRPPVSSVRVAWRRTWAKGGAGS